MKHLLAGALALALCSCAAPALAATCDGLPENTSGTTQNGMLAVLRDICGGSAQPIVPVRSASSASDNVVVLAVPGKFYSASVTPTSNGFLMVVDAVSKPSNGAISPLECVAAAANTTTTIDMGNKPDTAAIGVTLLYSSTGCTTFTASAVAFLTGRAQ